MSAMQMIRWTVSSALLVFAVGCGGDPPNSEQPTVAGDGRVDLTIQHAFGDDDLMLGAANETADGRPVTVDTLRYWISNLVLVNADGDEYRLPSAYYLVEQTAENTRTTVALSGLPNDIFTHLRFGIGVDAAHNHSLDLFEGELSTAVDMHWDWSTGFVFLKVEGTHGAVDDEARFVLHVGNDAMYQEVSVPLDGLDLTESTPVEIALRTDLSAVFEAIDLAVASEVIGGSPGSAAEAAIMGFAAGFGLAAR